MQITQMKLAILCLSLSYVLGLGHWREIKIFLKNEINWKG